MGLLDSNAELATMFQVTGGVQITAGSSVTWGHFDRVPVGVSTPGGGEALTTQPSIVIARGALATVGISDAGEAQGIGVAVTIALATGDVTKYVRDVVPGDEDGGTVRVMLSETASNV